MSVGLLIIFPLLLTLVSPQKCPSFTTSDQEGPYFVGNVTNKYKIAPDNDIQDPSKGAIIRGKILDMNCNGIAGATVDVWYAGYAGLYTFSTPFWYRGKQQTSEVNVFSCPRNWQL